MRRLFVLPPVLIVLLCGFLAISEGDETLVTVDAIRMGVDSEGQTRVVLDLDRRPVFVVGPARGAREEIVLHLEGGRFVMAPDGAGDQDGVGFVDKVAYAPNLVRLALSETALPVRSFVLPPAGDIDHFRLVVDLGAASDAEFAAEAKAFKEPAALPPVPTPLEKPRTRTVAKPVDLASAEPEKALPPPPSLKPMPDLPPEITLAASEPKPGQIKSRPLIVIDPGHGGHDSGAVGRRGTMEDTVTLSYAKSLAAVLETRGYDVALTRNDDSYVRHEDRIGFARERGADLFMSLHADSIDDPDVRGASVYTLSQHRSERLEDEIRRDGHFVLYDVEVSNDDGVGDILLDLAHSATRQNSDRLANALIGSMRSHMPLLKNPKRRGALLVLLSPDVPAVLVELAFLSNAQDEANLKSPAWRRKTVATLADGIDSYFDSVGVEQRLAGGSGSSG